jgi:hypothetical protein
MISNPRLNVVDEPDLAHSELVIRLREIGPNNELVDALAAHSEAVLDLTRAHQVTAHGQQHRQNPTRHLYNGTRTCRTVYVPTAYLPRTDWRPVPGFAAFASSAGEVRGPSGKVLKPYVSPDGYHHVLIRHRKLRVHHAVLLAFGFARPAGAECRHLDGDPSNNSMRNLKWGTRQENSDDKFTHDRVPFGEAKPDARLTVDQAQAIKYDTRASRVVGREYGVSHTAVLRIRRGDRWSTALSRPRSDTYAA